MAPRNRAENDPKLTLFLDTASVQLFPLSIEKLTLQEVALPENG